MVREQGVGTGGGVCPHPVRSVAGEAPSASQVWPPPVQLASGRAPECWFRSRETGPEPGRAQGPLLFFQPSLRLRADGRKSGMPPGPLSAPWRTEMSLSCQGCAERRAAQLKAPLQAGCPPGGECDGPERGRCCLGGGGSSDAGGAPTAPAASERSFLLPCRASWPTPTERTPGCSGQIPTAASSRSDSARYCPCPVLCGKGAVSGPGGRGLPACLLCLVLLGQSQHPGLARVLRIGPAPERPALSGTALWHHTQARQGLSRAFVPGCLSPPPTHTHPAPTHSPRVVVRATAWGGWKKVVGEEEALG